MKKKNFLLVGIGAALATAATFFFIRKKKNNANENPPKKAPQLKIENPGEQSEFITTATEPEQGTSK